MFPFWQSAMFGAVIGGIITVVLFKLWEKKGAVLALETNVNSGLQNMMSGFANCCKWVSFKSI